MVHWPLKVKDNVRNIKKKKKFPKMKLIFTVRVNYMRLCLLDVRIYMDIQRQGKLIISVNYKAANNSWSSDKYPIKIIQKNLSLSKILAWSNTVTVHL